MVLVFGLGQGGQPSLETQNMNTLMLALKDKAANQNPITKIAIGFILIAIALVIALTVLPLVADTVALTQASANVTGSSKTLLGLLPLLLIVGLVVGALAFLISGFKDLKDGV